MTSEELAALCAKAAASKQAVDIVALDMRDISTFTDFFVICSGTSDPHLKAIAGEIEDLVRKTDGTRPSAVDGRPISQWIVLDYGNVVVHVFHQAKREFYSLESFWGDAPHLALPEEQPGRTPHQQD